MDVFAYSKHDITLLEATVHVVVELMQLSVVVMRSRPQGEGIHVDVGLGEGLSYGELFPQGGEGEVGGGLRASLSTGHTLLVAVGDSSGAGQAALFPWDHV